jgi:hypothetical protein
MDTCYPEFDHCKCDFYITFDYDGRCAHEGLCMMWQTSLDAKGQYHENN